MATQTLNAKIDCQLIHQMISILGCEAWDQRESLLIEKNFYALSKQ